MKELPITVQVFSEDTPQEAFLSAKDVDAYKQAQHLLEQAEKTAQEKHQRAEEIRVAAEAEKQIILSRAQEAGQQLIQNMQEEFKQSVIKDTVHWLVKEENIENHVITTLEAKIRSEMAHAFHTLAADLDENQLLMNRIQDELIKLKDTESYILRAAKARFETTQTDLEKYQLTDRLQLITDDTLTQDEVILETPFFLLKINIKKHIDTIATYLQTPRHKSSA